MTEKDTQLLNEAFDRWWFNEGSGMPPSPDEDQEEHVHRIARIAWHNGAYVNLHHTQITITPNV